MAEGERVTATRLVLLPGMDGTGRLFGPLLRALPPGWDATVVRYPPDRRMGFAGYLTIVREAVPGAAPHVLVAESFSGPIAIEHASTRPPGLRALVLSATFARNPLPPSLHRLGILARPALFWARPPRSAVRAFLGDRECGAEILDDALAVVRSVSPAVMAHRLRMVLELDVTPSLAAIEVPVLYLGGSADRLVGLRGLAHIAAHLPGLSSAVLDAPHLLLQARPEAALREIRRFLDRVGTP